MIESEALLRRRPGPTKHVKYNSSGSYVISGKTKAYEYYICDYCGKEIRIEENKLNRTGGTVAFKGMKLALHNKCLNPMLKNIRG